MYWWILSVSWSLPKTVLFLSAPTRRIPETITALMSRLNIWRVLPPIFMSQWWRYEWFRLRALSIVFLVWSVTWARNLTRKWSFIWPVRIQSLTVRWLTRSVIRYSICCVTQPIMVLRVMRIVSHLVSPRLEISGWTLIRMVITLILRCVMTVPASILRRFVTKHLKRGWSRRSRQRLWLIRRLSICYFSQAFLLQTRLPMSPDEALVLTL